MGSGAVIPEAAQGSARLLEALEKLAEWAGSGPGGNGPSGPPSEDVVRAFEEALAGPSEGAEAEAAEMAQANSENVSSWILLFLIFSQVPQSHPRSEPGRTS